MEVLSYDLLLDVDYRSLRLAGTETIRMVVDSGEEQEGRRGFSLDCLGPEASKVTLDGRTVGFAHDRQGGKLIVSEVASGPATLTIEFSTKVADGLFGFYRSNYDHGAGYILTTDFEPNGARTLFPCIDHPAHKAEFDLSVITDGDLSVISNMPLREVVPIDERRSKFVFKRSPRMSTYLLYLGIGKFEQAERSVRNSQESVDVVVATTPGNAGKCTFALETATRLLRSYNDYYRLTYPLEKLHLVAVPEYAAGAMENWGAITFREMGLFVDQNTSVSRRRGVASVLAHEMAHQWFGDLVTMKWWNDLWLNESFATFMDARAIDGLFPDWHTWEDFLSGETAPAMDEDSLVNTHPIEAVVASSEEIGQIFDDISYGKGASVLRMIEAYVGEDDFREGISLYLKRYRFSNAESRDLWSSLEEAASQNVPLASTMERWVRTAGFPLVRVSLVRGDAAPSRPSLRFSQERFLLVPSGSETTQGDVWPIPLTFAVNGTVGRALMDQGSLEVNLPQEEGVTRLKVNPQQTGFYRVLYDEELYSIVEKEFDSMSGLDRWGVLNDLHAFLVSGRIDQELYFRFAERCLEARDSLVVEEVSGNLGMLRFLVSGTPDGAEILRLHRAFHRAQMERLGIIPRDKEDERDKILRGRIAQSLALGDREFASRLATQLRRFSSLDPNIRSAVVVAYAAAAEGDQESSALGTLTALLSSAESEEDVVRILTSLLAFRSRNAVVSMLDLALSGRINRADILYAVRLAAANPDAGDATWSWFRANLEELRGTFRGSAAIPNLLQGVIPMLGIARVGEVREFFSTTRIPEASNAIRRGLERLDVLSRLRERLVH